MKQLLSILFITFLSHTLLAQLEKDKTDLQIAIETGNTKQVRELIYKGAKVNESNKRGATPMKSAILSGQKEMVQILLDHGATSREGMQIASEKGDLELVKFLIDQQFDFEHSLVYAAEINHLRLVRLLVEKGADVKISQKRKKGLFSKYYVTPIKYAVKNGNKEMTHFLVDYGVPLSEAAHECFYHSQIEILKSLIDRSRKYEEMLEQAFIHENLAIIDYLSSKNADFKRLGNGNNSLLHISAEKGNLELSKICIDQQNLNVNLSNDLGETPLMLAVKSGNVNLVSYLIDSGANIQTENSKGETVLFYSKSDNLTLFNLLVKNGADVSHHTNDNTTLLINACKNKDFKIIRNLLENGADISHTNNDGYTAFQYLIAPHNRNPEITNMFLDKGADINARNERSGNTLMFYAIERGDIDCIKELKSRGADINATDTDGNRPRTRDTKTIQHIIENGADINALDRRHDSYLCVAIYDKNFELAHYLVSKGIDVNQHCYFTEPPLVKAIEDENFTLIQFLVDNGADVNATGYFDKNIMEYAERQGNQEIINYLKDQGAMTKKDKNDLYKRSIEMESRLKTAVATKNQASLVRNLKNVDGLIIQDRLIRRIALFAAEEGNPIVMELAIDKFNYDIETKLLGFNQTVLTIATINDNTSLVSYLIGKGANVKHVDAEGKTPKDYAESEAMKELFD